MDWGNKYAATIWPRPLAESQQVKTGRWGLAQGCFSGVAEGVWAARSPVRVAHWSCLQDATIGGKLSLMLNLVKLRRTSFIALAAMVMLALAPTVSKVMAAERVDSNPVEVCTTEGTKWVAVAELGQGDSSAHQQGPPSLHEHDGDCSYCSLQTTKFLSVSSQSIATTSVVSLLPPLFYQASKPLFAWAQARSRAPPIVSQS